MGTVGAHQQSLHVLGAHSDMRGEKNEEESQEKAAALAPTAGTAVQRVGACSERHV